MSRLHDWAAVDPLLCALPYPAPYGSVKALSRDTGIPQPSLDWRLRRLRFAAGQRSTRARAWSAADDARVATVVTALAAELGRTPGAVLTRAEVLGLETEGAHGP